jgi:hypothetical protein
MNDSFSFDVNAFIQESKAVLVNPKSYFSSMKISGGMTEPLVKAVMYGAVSGVIAFLWNLLKISAVSRGMFGGSVGIMALISPIIFGVIGLFIGAVILLVISSICKGNSDFEANIRVTAAIMVMFPISAFFSFAGHFKFIFGDIINLILSIYTIWLLYYGLIEALKANAETSKIVCYVLVALSVVSAVAGMWPR